MGIEAALNRYVDSLILITNPQQLPHFLSDHLLDWEWRDLWPDCLGKEGYVSFRKIIIDRVSREDVLEWIIKKSNVSLDKLYDPIILKSELIPIYKQWEKQSLEAYLEAIKRWVEDMEGYYINSNLAIPDNISWKIFADILAAVKMYE